MLMSSFRMFLSGSMTLLGFTYELRMILQSIQRRAVGSVLIYICPSNNVPTMLLPKIVHCNRQTAFGCWNKHENDWNLKVRAIQWIPTWQGLDLKMVALDESSLSIGRVKCDNTEQPLTSCYYSSK